MVKRKKSAKRTPRRKILKKSKKKVLKRRKKALKKTLSRKKTRKPAAKKVKRKIVKKKVLKKVAKPAKIVKKVEMKAETAPKKPTKEQKVEMKKTIGILSDAYIRQTLIEVGGENALAIIRNFYGNHSDEELAKKLKIKISDVRATLNKLHNEGLVNYIRQKDNETGWYSYSWSLNHNRMEKWANDQTSKIINAGGGDGENYYCPTCGTSTIMDFTDAISGDFRCAHCNRMLEFLDKTKMLEMYERRRL